MFRIPLHWALFVFSIALTRGIFGQDSASGPEGVTTASPAPTCTADGTFCEFSLPTQDAGPSGIVAGPDGNLWFTERASGKIGRITLAGEITEFQTPSGVNALGPIVVGPDGNLWFTEGAYREVGRTFTIIAKKIGRITPLGIVTEFEASIVPEQITAGPDGNLWYTTGVPLAAVFRIDPNGETSFVRQVLGPLSITSGPDGALWITQTNGDEKGEIGRLTIDGALTEYLAPSFAFPNSIMTGPDGALWFIETVPPGAIGRITLSGTVTAFPTSTGLVPFAMTTGSDGNLWFIEGPWGGGELRLGRITTSGVVTDYALPTTVFSIGSGGIARGSDGNLWFTELSENKIGRFAVSIDRARPSLTTRSPRRPGTRVLKPRS